MMGYKQGSSHNINTVNEDAKTNQKNYALMLEWGPGAPDKFFSCWIERSPGIPRKWNLNQSSWNGGK